MMLWKRWIALTLGLALAPWLLAAQARADVKEITGAGATFPFPIYSQWADAYSKSTGVKLNYQSIGSGGGIAQIKAKTVDFGASDLPLKPEQLDEIGLIQWPMVVGGVVPVIHVSGIAPGQMKMTPKMLLDIYLGKITNWNDPELKEGNAGINFPDKPLSVVRRSDGSGTTAIFTDYLSKISDEWKTKVGSSTSVNWPVGLGGKGNEGVAAYVLQIDGSVGYVELAYAIQNHMTYVQMENKDGKWVSPSLDTFAAAAGHADWKAAPGFYLMLTDQPGPTTWPISGATFILFYKNQTKPETAKAVMKFFSWCYQNGAGMAEKLEYVPIPQNVAKVVEASWHTHVKGPDGKPLWP